VYFLILMVATPNFIAYRAGSHVSDTEMEEAVRVLQLERVGNYDTTVLQATSYAVLNGGVKNPYTNRPIIMEASPGNFTVQRKNGVIIEVFLYHRSGVEYPLRY
jgi:hypothetical protein